MAEKQEYLTRSKHDYDFIDKIPDRFICQICAKVLCEPHLAVCCGQHFCESCLNKWFDRQRGKQSCPHCRAEGEAFNHVINKGLKCEINQLKIRCSNHVKGCHWTGELGALKAHLKSEKGCSFAMVECPNKCNNFGRIFILERKLLNSHLANGCYLRPYKCIFCGLKDTYQAITGGGFVSPISFSDYFGGHQATCPEVPLTCPNKCGSRNIKRKDMDSHRSKCPQEPVECPFAKAGCEGIVLRCELNDHMASNLQQHLMIVMKDSQKTKMKLQQIQDELKATQTKLTDAENRLNKTHAELTKTQSELIETKQRLPCRPSLAEQHVDTRVYKLRKSGDSIKLQMPKFSEYRRSGKVWHSPPFYYREGYKMCLAVYANGVGKGAGTHVSLSLLLLRGRYDDRLRWPMKFCDQQHHAVAPLREGSKIFLICSNSYHQGVNKHEQIYHTDRFCGQKSDAFHLVNDCLSLIVEFNSCYIIVRIA